MLSYDSYKGTHRAQNFIFFKIAPILVIFGLYGFSLMLISLVRSKTRFGGQKMVNSTILGKSTIFLKNGFNQLKKRLLRFKRARNSKEIMFLTSNLYLMVNWPPNEKTKILKKPDIHLKTGCQAFCESSIIDRDFVRGSLKSRENFQFSGYRIFKIGQQGAESWLIQGDP